MELGQRRTREQIAARPRRSENEGPGDAVSVAKTFVVGKHWGVGLMKATAPPKGASSAVIWPPWMAAG